MVITGASCLLLEQEADSGHDKAVSDRCKTKNWEVTLEKAPATAWRGAVAVKMLCAANSLSKGLSALTEATHAALGWWSNAQTQEGNAQAPLEMLFIFTDICSSVSAGQFHKGTLSLRETALPGLSWSRIQKEREVSQWASCRWGCWGNFSQMPPACSWPRWLLSTPRLKIKAEAWTMVWRWAAVSFLWKSILARHLANGICKFKRNQCKRRLLSKIPWVPWAVTDVTVETVCPHRMVIQ